MNASFIRIFCRSPDVIVDGLTLGTQNYRSPDIIVEGLTLGAEENTGPHIDSLEHKLVKYTWLTHDKRVQGVSK